MKVLAEVQTFVLLKLLLLFKYITIVCNKQYIHIT